VGATTPPVSSCSKHISGTLDIPVHHVMSVDVPLKYLKENHETLVKTEAKRSKNID